MDQPIACGHIVTTEMLMGSAEKGEYEGPSARATHEYGITCEAHL